MITSDVSGTLLAHRCRKINSFVSVKGTDYINITIQHVVVVVVVVVVVDDDDDDNDDDDDDDDDR